MSIANLRILVAEDHAFQRGTLVRALKTIGMQTVHEVANGHAALEVILDPERPVDIVISDLRMPGMDGIEFMRRLGQARARTSVVLTSALEPKLLASVATMAEAYGNRVLGVIEKPLTPGKLLPLFAQHLQELPRPQRPAGPTFTLEQIAAGLKNDEFEPLFQPKIHLATGRVQGAEALARWRHPQHGLVAPHAFIGPLEDHGMIDELMWVMLRKSAACCSAWRGAGLDMKVAVNLSVKSLGDEQLANRVTEIVRGQNLKPGHMVLEVTESAAATNTGQALENLARLRLKGFGLSIDDYGTGYSSMQQLTRIAFSELKVDQSFVMNAGKQESARVILESSLAMATKLGIVSVAEGVETRADYDLLCQLHCDMAQGYFIARPMEAGAYPDWVRDWKNPGCPA